MALTWSTASASARVWEAQSRFCAAISARRILRNTPGSPNCNLRFNTAINMSQYTDAIRTTDVKPHSPQMPFHLAIPVHDIEAAREFYGRVLGLPEGRSSKSWVDFNLFGHQLVCHEVTGYNAESSENAVDGDAVPVPHFGLAMSVPDFLALAGRVRAEGVEFIIEPHIRFKGHPGEQWTMFFKDKSGNSLEFKAMTNPNNLFAKYVVED